MSGGSPSTLFVGQRVIRLDQVDSTNNFAMGLLKGMPLEEGAVVTTARQTRGKGQRGNSWESQPGQNITCSVILRPVFLEPVKQFDLTRAVSLALTDVLLDIIPQHEVKIKWPNDIFVDDRKIAGILIENILNGNQLNYSVVGIGLNVNQVDFISGGAGATSLRMVTGNAFELDGILKMICAAVEVRYLQLRGRKEDKLDEEYFSRLFKAGITSKFTDFSAIFEATIVDVTHDGLLVLKDCNGLDRKFAMKEVGWIG
ncbi:MAG TPA: biotin--[acetyl-CoA-carboxylase] ligase [Bacteroidia bacterium]|nr:biotin--[acetyl-CoA-carboxylase] ligase [Bacteroidia bacterium]